MDVREATISVRGKECLQILHVAFWSKQFSSDRCVAGSHASAAHATCSRILDSHQLASLQSRILCLHGKPFHAKQVDVYLTRTPAASRTVLSSRGRLACGRAHRPHLPPPHLPPPPPPPPPPQTPAPPNPPPWFTVQSRSVAQTQRQRRVNPPLGQKKHRKKAGFLRKDPRNIVNSGVLKACEGSSPEFGDPSTATREPLGNNYYYYEGRRRRLPLLLLLHIIMSFTVAS